MSEEVKDVIITALTEKVLRQEKDIERLEHDVKLWQKVYHEKNARIAELETRIVTAGSKPNGSEAGNE